MKAQEGITKPFKLAVIGTQRVGKTSIIQRFHFGTFEKNTIATVGASFILHNFSIDGNDVSFQIWDTAGQEKYRSLGPIYYRDASCAIAVFDLTSEDSIEYMKVFINQFKQHCSDFVHMAIVGNKKDLYVAGKGANAAKVQQWAKSEGYSYYETSALTGDGVEDMFTEIANVVAKKSKQKVMNEAVKIDGNKEENSCC